jgi:hypothetical protein
MQHRVVTGLCVVVWLLATPAHADKARAQAHFRKGMAQYMLNRYSEAIPEFEAGFAEEPEPAFLFNLGQAHSRLGHYKEACDFYRKYLDMGPAPEDAPVVQKRIEELEALAAKQPLRDPMPVEPPKESTPAPPPAVLAPVAPPPKLQIDVAPPPPPRRSRAGLIAVGVIGGVVVVATVVGLAVGLSQHSEPSLLWSAR